MVQRGNSENGPKEVVRPSTGQVCGFQKKYVLELSRPENATLLERIAVMAEKGGVTLVYSARDTEHNSALVLAEIIGRLLKAKAR
jgi:uncharacterized protein YeaO (DUF488 family)